jgi:hypothetical protein
MACCFSMECVKIYKKQSVWIMDKKKARWMDDKAKVYSSLRFQTKASILFCFGQIFSALQTWSCRLQELLTTHWAGCAEHDWNSWPDLTSNVHYERECSWSAQSEYNSPKTREDGRVKFVALHDFLSNGHNLLGVSFIRSLKSNLCTAVTIRDTTENSSIISHTQNITALQLDVLLTGMHQLLITNKRGMACPAQTNSKVNWKLFSQYQ